MRRLLGCALLVLSGCTAAPPTPVVETTIPSTTTTAPPADTAEAVAMLSDCMAQAGFEVTVTVAEDGAPDLSGLIGETATAPGFRSALTDCVGPLVGFLQLDSSPGPAGDDRSPIHPIRRVHALKRGRGLPQSRSFLRRQPSAFSHPNRFLEPTLSSQPRSSLAPLPRA